MYSTRHSNGQAGSRQALFSHIKSETPRACSSDLTSLQLHWQSIVVEASDDAVAAAGDDDLVPGGRHLGAALVHPGAVDVLEGRQQLLLGPRRGAPRAICREPRPERAELAVAAKRGGGPLLRRLEIVLLLQQPWPCRHGRDALREEVLAGTNSSCSSGGGAFARCRSVEVPDVDVGVGTCRHEVLAVGGQRRRYQDLGASPS